MKSPGGPSIVISSRVPVITMALLPSTNRALVPSPSSTVMDAPSETVHPCTPIVITLGGELGLSGLVPGAGVPAGISEFWAVFSSLGGLILVLLGVVLSSAIEKLPVVVSAPADAASLARAVVSSAV